MADQTAVVRPKDVIAEIDKVYPPGLDGTGTIPVNEGTLECLQSILKSASRIPRDLRPAQQPDIGTFDHSLLLMREAVQRGLSKAAPYYGALPNLAAHGGRNPLAALRDVLLRCPDFTPKENRRRLLKLMAEYDRAGETTYPDTMASGGLGLPLKEARRLMEICEDEKTIKLNRSYGGVAATLTPAGWRSLEQPDPSMGHTDDDVIFISCGQFTEAERVLGMTLARLVDEGTAHKGYFAQNESSLEGLSSHIFGALNSCVGFVAVMHHRGIVNTLSGEQTRASVWVEQELAIAAFLAQAQGRSLPSVVYIQEGIALEGVRQHLLLGAVPFKENSEVIKHFTGWLRENLFGLTRDAPAKLGL